MNDPSKFGGEGQPGAMDPGPQHKTGHDHKPKPDDASKVGDGQSDSTNPKEPDQAKLDADRDTSEQVGGAVRDGG